MAIESLEERRLLSNSADILNAYDKGIAAVAAQSATLAAEAFNINLPAVTQSISQALNLVNDLQAPFQTAVDANGTLATASNQLQAAGFTVEYLSTTPENGTNDLLRLSRTLQWQPTATFTIGGATGFSYLDAAQGHLSGSLSATVPPIVLQVTFGVDLLNAAPAFYLRDSSNLMVKGVRVTGSASGDLSIGDLANVQASGSMSASFDAGLTFNQQLHPDHKLRLADLTKPIIGNFDGSVHLPLNFTASVPLLSGPISWTGDWTWSKAVNQSEPQISGGPVSPDAGSILSDLQKAVSTITEGFPLLGPIGDELTSSMPILGVSLASAFGVPTVPGGPHSSVTFNVTPDSLSKLIHGQQEDLVQFHFADQGSLPLGTDWKVPVFAIPFTVEGIPCSVQADIYGKIYFNWAYMVAGGIDTSGVWFDPSTHFQVTGGLEAGLDFGATVGGFDGIGVFDGTVSGGFGARVTANIGLTAPGESRLHLSEFAHPGDSFAQDLVKDFHADLTGQFYFKAEFKATALFGVITLVDTSTTIPIDTFLTPKHQIPQLPDIAEVQGGVNGTPWFILTKTGDLWEYGGNMDSPTLIAWNPDDLTAATKSPLAAGDPSGYVLGGGQHVVFRGTDGHIHELWWDPASGWHPNDLTAATGAPLAAGDPSGYVLGGGQHVVFRGTDSHIHELWWDPASGWHPNDLSAATGAPVAAGDPTGFASDDLQHVVFRTTDGHIHDLQWWGNQWHDIDLTVSTAAPLAQGDPQGYVLGNVVHVFFETTNGEIYELWRNEPG